MRGSDPAGPDRVDEVKESFQLKAQSGGDSRSYHSPGDTSRLLLAEVTKCSPFDQDGLTAT